MNPDERRHFERFDRMILQAGPKGLKKIQKLDIQTQLDGLPFYDACLGTELLQNQSIRQKSRKVRS
ncbi:MAG: hypothetical protein OXC46_01605 [Thaumarchaeota archaeon]|nr:hypothetical protein [Nitrososphaerota archaeon]